MDWKTGTYLVYLAVSIGLTVWVAQTLSRNGTVFLVAVFGGSEELGRSVNKLLVVGLYLVNLGFVSLALRTDAGIAGLTDAIEELSRKIGLVLLVVGLLHLLNVLVLSRMRRTRLAGEPTPYPYPAPQPVPHPHPQPGPFPPPPARP